MADDKLRKQFSAHAQDNLAKFQMKHILNDWNQVLQSLL